MSTPIAIVGLACEFPGASSPEALWETVLACRTWFRNIPSSRMNEAYLDVLGERADTTRLQRAALLEGYVPPQARFSLGENDLRSADFTHWLALDCADRALTDSGLADLIPRDATRVIVGNSLTGESSRADLLRLRWPYVRKTLEESGCTGSAADWARREHFFKARLTRIDGRTLAGALSNVIAGRIANQLDLRGGGYCVDAACASSLVAMSQACSQLAYGEIDCCIVGGVDVSLDPLELIGFSVAGALAGGEMKVFDRNRSGFIPGEGCGFAVLIRADHPLIAKCNIRAIIKGWAITSDGRHDLTAPSEQGQRLALERAYTMAGYGISTVPFFEAHGTGTVIGDQVELSTLASAIGRTPARVGTQAAIGSIKANIGHTKAAAGMAGIIKAIMALESRIIPPTTGCSEPMAEVSSPKRSLRLVESAEGWQTDQALRAGVSAFGFGGVNAHLTLEAHTPTPHKNIVPVIWNSPLQDAELFLFDGIDHPDLLRRIVKVQAFSLNLADAELAPAAEATISTLKNRRLRAAVIARTPSELHERLQSLQRLITEAPSDNRLDGVFFQEITSTPRIGFLFPGQGGILDAGAGRLWSRFRNLLSGIDSTALTARQTDSAAHIQSTLTTTSTTASNLLVAFGIYPTACIGHSLGEISALCAAGAFTTLDAVSLAHDRGRLMDDEPLVRGQMEVLFTSEHEARKIINGHPVAIAAFNSPSQTIIAGPHDAVAAVVSEAHESNVATATLTRRFAFHSPAMQSLVEPFSARLRATQFSNPKIPVFSTVTGSRLPTDTELTSHLSAQLTTTVQFQQAFASAEQSIDLWIEVGAGRVLTGLLPTANVVPLEVESPSIAPFLQTLAAAFVHGANVNFSLLYADRRLPAFDLDWVPRFFTNPCERPLPDVSIPPFEQISSQPLHQDPATAPPFSILHNSPLRTATTARSSLDIVRAALAERKGADYAASSIHEHQTLGPDLGVDSLGLIELTAHAEKALGRRPASHPLKKMTVAEFVALFDTSTSPPALSTASTLSDQAAPWVRAFEVVWDEFPPRPHSITPPSSASAAWSIIPHSPHSATTKIIALLPPTPTGLLIYCNKETDEHFLDEMLAALRTHPEAAPIIFLDSTAQLPGFAKSLALEQPSRPILFVHFSEETTPVAATVADELHDLSGFHEVRFDAGGRRFLPRCQVIESTPLADDLPVSFEDVVLVTGGAKGITAECMVALAANTGASFAIVGRSSAEDPGVLATLKKLTAMGIAHHYWSADISDAASTADLIRSVTATLGTITAIIHGAGIHTPCDVSSMSATLMQQHCRAKVEGLRNLLSMVDPTALKLLVAFGSIIAHSGYARSGAYAFANDKIARLIAGFHSCHPFTRCQTLDWSAWLETGMGVNLGAIDEMKSTGVDPIRIEQGVEIFLNCLRSPTLPPRPILSGRLPSFPTVSFRSSPFNIDLPEATVVAHTPGVEIIVDTSLSLNSHSFLAGHSLDGQVILPGVLLLEFMQRAASSLRTDEPLPLITDVTFSRPVPLPAKGPLILRIQAIRQPDNSVHCMVSPSHESLADAPSVSANFGHATPEPATTTASVPDSNLEAGEGAAIAGELYEHLLFHTDAFRIVKSYSTATAKTAVFHLLSSKESEPLAPTFSGIVIRDALIHGIQICVPGQQLLPSKVSSITRLSSAVNARAIIANEISSQDNEFTYDFIAVDANGSAVEIWKGLVLRPYRTLQIASSHHRILQVIHKERSGQPVPAPQPTSQSSKRYFEYRHTVGFKETNLVGNVYFTNHLEWQGRCREMFLYRHAPALLKDVQSGQLALVTVSCSCEYLAELQPFDELSIRMTLEAQGHDWATMRFDYWRETQGTPLIVAVGHQKIASRHRSTKGLASTPLPISLVSALQPFA